MKLVQARVGDVEYELLKRRVKAQGITIQEFVRRALRESLLPDRIDPKDPLLTHPGFGDARGKKTNYAEDHDKYLYGEYP